MDAARKPRKHQWIDFFIMNKVIRCGIMSLDQFRERTMKIVRGEYKPKSNDPKIWFESLNAAAQILNPDNIELLKIIDRDKPESIAHLSSISGRKPGNLSRTLKKLSRYGIVNLEKSKGRVKPVAKATDFRLDFGVNTPFC